MLNTIFNIDTNELGSFIRLKTEGVAIYSEYLEWILKTDPLNDNLIKKVKKELEKEKEELREAFKSLWEYQR